MIVSDFDQQLEIQAQQTFRSDDPVSIFFLKKKNQFDI
jgi:hypothetical protein